MPGGPADRSWPVLETIVFVPLSLHQRLPPFAFMHMARLCPRLREVSTEVPLAAAELAAALEGLAPAARTLEALEFSVGDYTDDPPDTDADTADEEERELGAAPGAAEALGHLSGLRRLSVGWDRQPGAAALLASLSAPTLLSSLKLDIGEWWEGAQPPQAPDLRPGSLRKLALECDDAQHALHALRAIPRLGGVTNLELTMSG